MTQEDSDLRIACFDVARGLCWRHEDSLSTSLDELTPFVVELIEIANRKLRDVPADRDPQVVSRAVKYLANYAVPPIGPSLRWFEDSLTVLMDLAIPDPNIGRGDVEFLKDLQQGIAAMIRDAETT